MTQMQTKPLTAAPAIPATLPSFRYVWFVVIGFLTAVLTPLLLIAQVPDVGRSSAWILTLALMVWSGIRIAMVIARGLPTLFDFFFLIFVYVFMGMAPTVQMRSSLLSTTTPGINAALDVPTAVMVVLGVACYEIGRLIYFARVRRAAVILRLEPVARVRPGVSLVSGSRAVILLILGVGLSGYYISKVGFGSLFESRTQAEAIRAAVWSDPATRSVFYALAIYPLLIGVGAIAQVRRTGRRTLSAWYAILIVIGAVTLLIIVNPISSARYSLGTVIFALVVYLGVLATPTRVRVTMTATVGALIFLFPLADAFRTPAVSFVRASFFGEYQSNPDYDAFWQIANSYSYVQDGLVQGGRQALGSLLFWVPRAIYPDKPIDTGVLLANYRGYSFTNLSAPLWAEFLVNGGVPVLILGFLVTGYLLRAFDRRLPNAFRQAGLWAIAGAVFPVYMMILLRGSLLQATGAVVVALVCLLWVRRAGPLQSAPLIRPHTQQRALARSLPSRIPSVPHERRSDPA